jgi:hypothetical protein
MSLGACRHGARGWTIRVQFIECLCNFLVEEIPGTLIAWRTVRNRLVFTLL